MKSAINNNYSIIRISQEDVYNNLIDWKNLLIKYTQIISNKKVYYISYNSNLYNLYKEEIPESLLL